MSVNNEDLPSVDAVRPRYCVGCRKAARWSRSGLLAIYGHGIVRRLIERHRVRCRRYRCRHCGCVMTVVPADLVPWLRYKLSTVLTTVFVFATDTAATALAELRPDNASGHLDFKLLRRWTVALSQWLGVEIRGPPKVQAAHLVAECLTHCPSSERNLSSIEQLRRGAHIMMLMQFPSS